MDQEKQTVGLDAKRVAKKGAYRRTGWLVATGMVVLALGGTSVANAFGRTGSFGGGHMGQSMMNGLGGAGISRVLERIDATPEQQEKIESLVAGFQQDFTPALGELEETRETLLTLLSAETIDREALETLRAEQVAKLDAASKEAFGVIADIANELTAEQRADLVENFKGFGPRRPW